MILIDFNQIVIGSYIGLNKSAKGRNFIPVGIGGSAVEVTVGIDLVRHIVLNSIRDIRKKFGKQYGELVICCDGRNYWRKEKFKYYKALRKQGRDAMAETQDVDWKVLFESMNTIRDELRTVFPYKLLCVDRAETDDLIATIVKFTSKQAEDDDSFFGSLPPEDILIISSDKDFKQLQVYPNVRQWSPLKKAFVEEKAPKTYLMEHILKGDGGDGVPNVLSVDNSFVDKIRQKTLTSKKMAAIMTAWEQGKLSSVLDEQQMKHFERNKTMCDLINSIPEDLSEKIIQAYREPAKGSRKNLMMYFANHRMKNLMNMIEDF